MKYRLTLRGKIQLILFLIIIAALCIWRVDAVAKKNFKIIEEPKPVKATGVVFEPVVEVVYAEDLAETEENDIVEEEEDFEIYIDEADIKILGNCLYGEARGMGSTERSAVIWCILNRVDSPKFPNTIKEVVTAPYQFTGYNANREYRSEAAKEVLAGCEDLCRDVLIRYYKEKAGEENVGRTLPSTYCFFYGKNGHNWFREEWKGTNLWDWSLGTPYED